MTGARQVRIGRRDKYGGEDGVSTLCEDLWRGRGRRRHRWCGGACAAARDGAHGGHGGTDGSGGQESRDHAAERRQQHAQRGGVFRDTRQVLGQGGQQRRQERRRDDSPPLHVAVVGEEPRGNGRGQRDRRVHPRPPHVHRRLGRGREGRRRTTRQRVFAVVQDEVQLLRRRMQIEDAEGVLMRAVLRGHCHHRNLSPCQRSLKRRFRLEKDVEPF